MFVDVLPNRSEGASLRIGETNARLSAGSRRHRGEPVPASIALRYIRVDAWRILQARAVGNWENLNDSTVSSADTDLSDCAGFMDVRFIIVS
jgi:hypothetical protein